MWRFLSVSSVFKPKFSVRIVQRGLSDMVTAWNLFRRSPRNEKLRSGFSVLVNNILSIYFSSWNENTGKNHKTVSRDTLRKIVLVVAVFRRRPASPLKSARKIGSCYCKIILRIQDQMLQSERQHSLFNRSQRRTIALCNPSKIPEVLEELHLAVIVGTIAKLTATKHQQWTLGTRIKMLHFL